jgi:predicted AlkP superfamily pyrophosphatase or phosphodiesterase
MKARALLLLFALAAPFAWGGAPLVILMSWDGMRHDYLDRAPFPGLTRMQRDGLRAERLIAGWPSSTFPGHVTLATGAWADVHGIVDNEFLDRTRGRYAYSSDASWLEAEPLWIAAERQGIRAATYFWVGSETDWRGQKQHYRIAPFDAERPEAAKVDQMLAWIDLPADERPGLIMAYWRGADGVGHRRGPDSPKIVEQIYAQDAQLLRLLDGIDARHLWADTTVLIASDHGMTALHDTFDLEGFLAEHGFRSRVFGGPGVAHIYLDDAAQRDAAEALLSAHPPLRVYRGDQLPAALHLAFPGRTGDLVVISDPSTPLWYPAWWVRATYAVLGPVADIYPGSHGFDPNLPEMGAILLAMGRGVPKGARIGAVQMTDVAPTVAKLLGIEPPLQSVGTPIPNVAP